MFAELFTSLCFGSGYLWFHTSLQNLDPSNQPRPSASIKPGKVWGVFSLVHARRALLSSLGKQVSCVGGFGSSAVQPPGGSVCKRSLTLVEQMFPCGIMSQSTRRMWEKEEGMRKRDRTERRRSSEETSQRDLCIGAKLEDRMRDWKLKIQINCPTLDSGSLEISARQHAGKKRDLIYLENLYCNISVHHRCIVSLNFPILDLISEAWLWFQVQSDNFDVKTLGSVCFPHRLAGTILQLFSGTKRIKDVILLLFRTDSLLIWRLNTLIGSDRSVKTRSLSLTRTKNDLFVFGADVFPT